MGVRQDDVQNVAHVPTSAVVAAVAVVDGGGCGCRETVPTLLTSTHRRPGPERRSDLRNGRGTRICRYLSVLFTNVTQPKGAERAVNLAVISSLRHCVSPPSREGTPI